MTNTIFIYQSVLFIDQYSMTYYTTINTLIIRTTHFVTDLFPKTMKMKWTDF